MNETYYYGQGKFYVARRNSDGRPGAWRFVGDVSSLSVNLVAEYKSKKSSVGGKLALTERYKVSETATFSAIWHEIISENLAIYLHGHRIQTFAKKETITLSSPIFAGERHTLDHPNVWGVVIRGLDENIDYIVEPTWGALVFLTSPSIRPLVVSYKHAGNTSAAIYTHNPEELAVRYEGINLAEHGDNIIVEFYRVTFDPAALIELINNSGDLAGVNTEGTLLLDLSKPMNSEMGQYGRIIYVPEMLSIGTTLTPVYTTGSLSGEIATVYPKD